MPPLNYNIMTLIFIIVLILSHLSSGNKLVLRNSGHYESILRVFREDFQHTCF
jgi:hypothetical protein